MHVQNNTTRNNWSTLQHNLPPVHSTWIGNILLRNDSPTRAPAERIATQTTRESRRHARRKRTKLEKIPIIGVYNNSIKASESEVETPVQRRCQHHSATRSQSIPESKNPDVILHRIEEILTFKNGNGQDKKRRSRKGLSQQEEELVDEKLSSSWSSFTQLPQDDQDYESIQNKIKLNKEKIFDEKLSFSSMSIPSNHNPAKYWDIKNHVEKEHRKSTPQERCTNYEDEDYGSPVCKSNIVMHQLTFQWDISRFYSIRKLAAVKALPFNDRLISKSFGSNRSGFWHLAFFPYGAAHSHKHVSLYLFSDDPVQRVSAFRVSLLNESGTEIEGTSLEENPRVFTPDKVNGIDGTSWGWHEYVTVPNEESFKSYLHNEETLSIKIMVTVYSRIEEIIGPRHTIKTFYELYRNQEQQSFIRHMRRMRPAVLQKLPTSTNSIIRQDTYQIKPMNKEGRMKDKNPLLNCSVVDDIKELLLRCPEIYRDTRLLCSDNITVYANRMILASRSQIFRNIISNKTQHNNNNNLFIYIPISNMTLLVINSFIEYLETDRCKLLSDLDEYSNDILSQVMKLWVLADFYLVNKLYFECVTILVRMINKSTAIRIKKLSEKLQCDQLVEAAKYIMRKNSLEEEKE